MKVIHISGRAEDVFKALQYIVDKEGNKTIGQLEQEVLMKMISGHIENHERR